MSQNSKLLNLATKASIKQCKYILETAKIYLISYSYPIAWWEQRDHDFKIYLIFVKITNNSQ